MSLPLPSPLQRPLSPPYFSCHSFMSWWVFCTSSSSRSWSTSCSSSSTRTQPTPDCNKQCCCCCLCCCGSRCCTPIPPTTFPHLDGIDAPLPSVPSSDGFALSSEMDAAPISQKLTVTQAQQIDFPPPPFGCDHPQLAPHCQLTLHEQYYSALLNLMCWKDGRAYTSDHQFTRDELLVIHADHVYCHFKESVYGDPDADEGSTHP